MRQLMILLALAALTLTNSGCTRCFGRCRNLFHKGSPCGTAVAPAVLGAPLAMGTPFSMPVAAPMAAPMMSAPMCVEQAPVCMPCDPCADPCSGGMSMGYLGGFTSDGACCESTGAIPMTVAPTTAAPTGQILPSPGVEQ
jgi:hypothetical protein